MQDRVYQTPFQDVTDMKQHLTDTWNGSLLQSIANDVGDEWRKRLGAHVKDKGGHFEHML